MKELKVKVNLNDENKVLTIEPLNAATGKTAETKIMTARLLTQADVDREIRELMQDGIHTYEKRKGRTRQIK